MSEIIKMNKESSITIKDGCEQFYRWCKVKGFSDYTVEFYREAVRNFSLFTSLEQPINIFDKTMFEDYSIFLQQKGIKSTTVYLSQNH